MRHVLLLVRETDIKHSCRNHFIINLLIHPFVPSMFQCLFVLYIRKELFTAFSSQKGPWLLNKLLHSRLLFHIITQRFVFSCLFSHIRWFYLKKEKIPSFSFVVVFVVVDSSFFQFLVLSGCIYIYIYSLHHFLPHPWKVRENKEACKVQVHVWSHHVIIVRTIIYHLTGNDNIFTFCTIINTLFLYIICVCADLCT